MAFLVLLSVTVASGLQTPEVPSTPIATPSTPSIPSVIPETPTVDLSQPDLTCTLSCPAAQATEDGWQEITAPAPTTRPTGGDAAAVPESLVAAMWWSTAVLFIGSLATKLWWFGPGRLTGALGILLRWGMAAPLFSRIIEARILDNPNRAEIQALIERVPGISVQEIQKEVDLAWGTVVYHLDRLERNGKVVAQRSGNHRRYFLNGTPEANMRRSWSALEQPTARQIAMAVAANPGIHQAAICESLAIRGPNASKHLSSLEKHGLVEKRRISRYAIYEPTRALEAVLERRDDAGTALTSPCLDDLSSLDSSNKA